MPTPTYIPLATKTLTATATSVTFSSISQAYRDLVLVVTQTGISSALVRINNDSASNYFWVVMYGDGTTAASYAPASATALQESMTWNGVPTSGRINTMHFMDYSATDKHKTVLSRFNHASTGTEAFAQRWASTAAITTVTATNSSGSMGVGTVATLYGIQS